MTEKQQIRESINRKLTMAKENGHTDAEEFYEAAINLLDTAYRDDTQELTAKRPLSELPVIEGKEVRITGGETE